MAEDFQDPFRLGRGGTAKLAAAALVLLGLAAGLYLALLEPRAAVEPTPAPQPRASWDRGREDAAPLPGAEPARPHPRALQRRSSD